MSVIDKFPLLLLPLLEGVGLGGFYFLGLWWTVRRISVVRRPELWFVGSFVLRTAVVVTGFYWVMGGQWQRLLACLVGFILVRLLLVGVIGKVRRRVITSPQ